jgi:hypothetical protein
MHNSDRWGDPRPKAKDQSEYQTISPGQSDSLRRGTSEDLDLMTENKILKLESSARSEAVGKLTEQQSECLDHEIQTNRQPTESHEIQWNQGLRKPHHPPAL